MRNLLLLAIAGILSAGAFINPASAQKMSADDVVAKSLAAVGTPEVRAKIQNMAAMGEVTAEKLKSGGMPPATGKAAFGTEGKKLLLNMGFPPATYPGERITDDGKDVKVALVRPGARSALGDYFFRYDNIIKQGLLGGVLSTGWLLNDTSKLDGKLYFNGTKKVDGEEAYVLNYESKKNDEMKVRLYFDKDTFRHIRTEYSVTVTPSMATTPTAAAASWAGHEELTEDFGDFKTENGLTLPRSYKLRLHIETNSAQADYSYAFAFNNMLYNANLEPGTFNQ